MARKAIFIALDNSGSMAGEKIEALRMSMIRLIDGFSTFIDEPGNTLDLSLSIWSDVNETRVWRDISRAGLGGAVSWLDRLKADGGGANFAAFAPSARDFFTETLGGPSYDDRTMIFLTDGEPTPLSSADTAAATLVDVLDRATTPFSTLDSTAVDCYAANIEVGTTVHTAKLDNTGTDGVPVIAGSERALTAYLKAVTLPPPNNRLWGWPIQWSDGYEEDLAFRTEIIVSRDGHEQRIGQRINPRVNYDFTSVLRGSQFRSALTRIAKDQGGEFYVPHPREPVTLASGLPAAGLFFDIAGPPPRWLIPGVYVVLQSPNGFVSIGVVIGISGSQINLAIPVGVVFPAGTQARLGVEGRFDGSSEINVLTSDRAVVQTQFTGDPVDTPHLSYRAAPVTLDGVEFFDMRPNWRRGMELKFEQQIELLDLNRGAIDALFPIWASPRTLKLNYTAKNLTDLDRILGLFYRSSGRRKRFFMPLWTDEIRPLGVTFSGQSTVTIRGSDFAETYGTDLAYKRILVRRRGFLTDLYLGVSAITKDSGGNSVITLTAPAPDDIIEQEITSMNWIMPVRFASDRLTVNWLTDGVAQITISVMTLEHEA